MINTLTVENPNNIETSEVLKSVEKLIPTMIRHIDNSPWARERTLKVKDPFNDVKLVVKEKAGD